MAEPCCQADSARFQEVLDVAVLWRAFKVWQRLGQHLQIAQHMIVEYVVVSDYRFHKTLLCGTNGSDVDDLSLSSLPLRKA